jgi:molybdenum cofactor cytidylyltransferase
VPFGAIVLAAGASSRLGQAKQLVVHRGRPLLRGAAEEALAARCDRVLVVLGAHEREVRAALVGLPVDVVVNDGWGEGMASSIRCGVEWAVREGGEAWEGALFLVCDQPALSAAHLERLLGARQEGVAAVASRYAGSVGIPAFIGRALFPRLLELRGNEGAKRVLVASAPATVDWPEGAIDLDTPEDLASLRTEPR